jgi:hypothetical protein
MREAPNIQVSFRSLSPEDLGDWLLSLEFRVSLSPVLRVGRVALIRRAAYHLTCTKLAKTYSGIE